jgi:hypothetical protein
MDSSRVIATALTPLTVAAGDCKGIRYIDAGEDVSKLLKLEGKIQLTITMSRPPGTPTLVCVY